ncbi:DUF5017 domain-containing protein [Niabella aurantiaca]|uniref:DUF5017 domain-containing protein n=1 Tax=Niabella aurantiaca TaxID=379900 RepID=UPI00036AECB7|nr:DUF5017 domain-containing protein [Niabella aurantiaca]
MNRYFILIVAVLLLSSCQKRYELVTMDTVAVQLEKDTYAVGDTVRFLISGNPDNMVFWSGVPGHVYEYRNRTFTEGNVLSLNFKSYSQYGQVDQTNLKVLVSNDFTGIYDSANIRSATWNDITDRAVLSSGADQTPSGEISLDDFASANKPIAIAFRYVTSVVKPATTQNRWVLRSFDLNSTNADGDVSLLASMSTAGWTSRSFAGTSSNWAISSSQLITTRNFAELDDDWVITRQFNPNKVSPDRGVAIKNISENLSEYTAVYDRPGVFRVTFVVTNANVKSQVSAIKEFDLHITPTQQ